MLLSDLFLLTKAQAVTIDVERMVLALREDTADAERFVKEGWSRAQDDHLTTSLSAQLDLRTARRSWESSLLLEVITHRDGGRRTDLGVLRVSTLREAGALTLRIGSGLMGNGNFGGEFLQNTYHALGNHPDLQLDYPDDTRMGHLLEASIAYRKATPAGVSLEFGFSTLDAPAAGYHRVRGTLVAGGSLASRLSWECSLGVSRLHHLATNIATSLQSGFDYGVLLEFRPTPSLGLSCWMMPNQFRKDQTSVGVSLTFGPGVSHTQLGRETRLH